MDARTALDRPATSKGAHLTAFHLVADSTGYRPTSGRPPKAVYRAITGRDIAAGHDGIPLSLAIRQSVGFDAIAAALGAAPTTLRQSIVYGKRGVRPADAQRIARMVGHPVADLFIDTRTLGAAAGGPTT